MMKNARCYSCMEEIPQAGRQCPHCGYDNARGPQMQPKNALPCGTVLLGRYEIGKVLGQGGFGITYIAFDRAVSLKVCIKEYFPSGAAMRNASQGNTVHWSGGENAALLMRGRERFIREARKAATLRNLNAVVKVWDVFFEHETAYIVMDYAEGVTLKEYIDDGERLLSEERCIELLSPVMRDLHKAHTCGIVHRDISPDNLMLRPDNTIVLLDMDGAKDLSFGSTKSSFAVAKQGFSPLEQYSKTAVFGAWTDIYAMCATIVYCVSGKTPPSPMERMNGEIIDLSDFSHPVAEVLEKGLAIRAEDRLQNMNEFCNMLNRALEQPAPAVASSPAASQTIHVQPAVKSQANETWETGKPRRRRGKRLILPLLVAGLALGVVSGVRFVHMEGLFSKTGLFSKASPSPVPSPVEEIVNTTDVRTLAAPQTPEVDDQMEKYRKAAELGDNTAMFQLGSSYYDGTVVSRDYAKALEWFVKAAKAGNVEAMMMAAIMYEQGLGTDKDLVEAVIWYQKAADAGDEKAKAKLAEPKLRRIASTMKLQEQATHLNGQWGEPEGIYNGAASPFFLDATVYDCDVITLILRILEGYSGWPWGEFGIFIRDLNGNWIQAALFSTEKSMADGTPNTYLLHLNGSYSFDALAICVVENGMEFRIEMEADFFVPKDTNYKSLSSRPDYSDDAVIPSVSTSSTNTGGQWTNPTDWYYDQGSQSTEPSGDTSAQDTTSSGQQPSEGQPGTVQIAVMKPGSISYTPNDNTGGDYSGNGDMEIGDSGGADSGSETVYVAPAPGYNFDMPSNSTIIGNVG